MNNFKINSLIVTQEGFRNEPQMTDMMRFISRGGVFDIDSLGVFSNGKDIRLISISIFEDERCFIHDGHHRVAAIYLGGRDFLYKSEYTIKSWTYLDYMESNLEKGWITPFDPRCEVRLSDYTEFKNDIKSIMGSNKEFIDFVIRANRATYVLPRRSLTIQDMLSRV